MIEGKSNKNMSTLAAAAAGAAVGAGVAVAGMVLSDNNKREKIKNSANKAIDKGKDTAKDLKVKSAEVKEDTEEKVKEEDKK